MQDEFAVLIDPKIMYLEQRGHAKGSNSIAIVFSDTCDVVEFYGNVQDLDDLRGNLMELVNFDEPHKDAIVLRCTHWEEGYTDRYPNNPAFVQYLPEYSNWEIVEEFDWEIEDFSRLPEMERNPNGMGL